jgi:glycosyltransferase involved in cell wall biosynthesis
VIKLPALGQCRLFLVFIYKMVSIPRVALFADTFHEANGAANFLRRLTAFAKHNKYPFLCVRSGEETKLYNDGSVEILDLKRGRVSIPIDGDLKYDPFLWKNRKLVKHTLRDFQPDVIHVTGLNDISQFGFFHAHWMNIPAVATWHTNTHEYAAERFLSLMPWLPKKTGRTICKAVERSVMFGLMKLYFSAQMQLAPNPDLVNEINRMTGRPSFLLRRGVETELLCPKKRNRADDDKDVIIGFVGRLRPEKNVRFLGRLDQALQKGGLKNYRFLIVGDGDERRWLTENLTDAEFTGEIRGEAVAKAFANMDLFVFPSLTDAFANVVLEAMSAGVPAIAFPVGGPKFLIEDKVSGFIAVSENDMTKKVAEIVRYPEQLGPMRAAARRFAEENSWDAIFNKTYEYYVTCARYDKKVRWCPINGIMNPRPKYK